MRRIARRPLLLASAVLLALPLGGAARAAPVVLSVPKVEAKAAGEVEVPILVRGAKGLSALQLRLSYDPDVLEVVKDADDPDKTFTRGPIVPERSIVQVFTDVPGRLPVVFVGGADPERKEIAAIGADGPLVTIHFRARGPAGRTTPLTLEKAQGFLTNDMDAPVQTEPGECAVTAAAAEPVAAPPAAAAPAAAGFPWLLVLIAVGVLVLLVVLLVLFLLFRRRPEAAPAGRPAPASRRPAAATVPTRAPAKNMHRCSECGKSVTLPAAVAGKKFRCPGCGSTQRAPGAGPSAE